MARLAHEHPALELRIDAQTAPPRCAGERVDYDAVVHALVSGAPCASARHEHVLLTGPW